MGNDVSKLNRPSSKSGRRPGGLSTSSSRSTPDATLGSREDPAASKPALLEDPSMMSIKLNDTTARLKLKRTASGRIELRLPDDTGGGVSSGDGVLGGWGWY